MAQKRKRESEWIDTVLKKGTIADRLAAHTLLVHESKSWDSLSALIDMVDPKKCRRRCVMAMSTLKELFIESLNLKNRKDGTNFEADDKKKIHFYFTRFIDQLSLVASDNLEETRKKAIYTLSELLTKYSDNKDYIIERLVSKLADKSPKLATSAGHLIEKSVNSESLEIRTKTIKYIQRFLGRPNQTAKARYYAVALLSRLKLIKGQHDLANDLVNTYLNLYTTLFKEDKTDSKMMSTILVGVHRAYPYTKLGNDVFEGHLQTLYTLAHQVNFRMRVVAMVLIKNIVTKRAQILKLPVEDRFYNLVFSQLLHPDLRTTSRQQAFVSLLLNVINEDTVLERKEAFIKRMLQVALNSQPEFAQLLLTTITKIKGYNTDLFTNSRDDDEQVDDDREEHGDSEDSNSQNSTEGVSVGSSWVHRPERGNKSCDLLARNPRSARPEHMNELILLAQFFDPAVSEVAQQLTKK